MTALEYITNLQETSRKNVATERIRKRWALLSRSHLQSTSEGSASDVNASKSLADAAKASGVAHRQVARA